MPTAATSAASACSSPSMARLGHRVFTIRSASRILSMRSCSAEPFVEKESKATRGSVCKNVRAFSAVVRAISANSSAEGSGTTPQSAKNIAPLSPKTAPPRGGTIMRKKLETSLLPGARPIARSAARIVSAVEFVAPPTDPSASPTATRSAAKKSGLRTICCASSKVVPLERRCSK